MVSSWVVGASFLDLGFGFVFVFDLAFGFDVVVSEGGMVLQGASGKLSSVKKARTFSGALCSLNQVVPGSESVSSVSSLSVSSLAVDSLAVSSLTLVSARSGAWVGAGCCAGVVFEERCERVLL